MSLLARLPRNTVHLPAAAGRRYYDRAAFSRYRDFIQISAEVQDALRRKAPVVALESATLSHPNLSYGLPYPDNIEFASRAEQVIRKAGAIPATISVIGGLIRVGTLQSFFERLSSKYSLRISRRDLPFALGMVRKSGGCTVAAAMAIAEMVGIKVLATSGLGGVHRAASLMMDVSADIGELGRTNVAVVCSGPRPYLDLAGTMEYLETAGVPVATFREYHPDETLALEETMVPTFYSHGGPVKSPMVINTAAEAALIIHAAHALGLETGQLICNPVPDRNEIDYNIINKSIRTTFKFARKKNKRQKEDIPHIIAQTRRSARVEAIPAEKALILSNAKKAAEIAIELSRIEGGPGQVESIIPPVAKRGGLANAKNYVPGKGVEKGVQWKEKIEQSWRGDRGSSS